ncbi:MAG: hypothetical protein ACNI26_09365 [Terasakiella sp.]|uniref:hypothetical protein n=1 Tax=unclassified Terasakiella TaxID=2614952 RepID=UPI003AFFAD5C
MTEQELKQAISHWLSLSLAKRHGLSALVNEVDTANQLLQTSVEQLSQQFLIMAEIAQEQVVQIDKFQERECIAQGNKTGEPVLMSLQRLERELCTKIKENEEKQNDALELDQASLLLMTEIAKEGSAEPVNFDVLRQVYEKIKKHNTLNELGNSSHDRRQHIDLIRHALADITEVENMLEETGKSAHGLQQSIADIVVKMQFQDRTNQRFSRIAATLKVMIDMLSGMEEETMYVCDDIDCIDPDHPWLEKMIAELHLNEMRERFVKHILLDVEDKMESGGSSIDVEHSNASDEIELF